MAAHRYWRVLMDRNNSNGRAALKKLEMRATVGGADQCTGGTPLTSGTSSGTTAAMAFDNSAATEWQSEIGPNQGFASIGYNFGSAVDVLEIALTLGVNASMQSSSAYLSYSDDGAVWDFLAPYLNLTAYAASATAVLSGFAARGGHLVRGAVLSLSPGWPAQAINAQVRGSLARIDAEDGGPYRIAGTTEREVTPGVFVAHPNRRVRLFERLTGRLVREQWSDPLTGAYEFSQIKLREYILLTDDHARYYNAVAADLITPML